MYASLSVYFEGKYDFDHDKSYMFAKYMLSKPHIFDFNFDIIAYENREKLI